MLSSCYKKNQFIVDSRSRSNCNYMYESLTIFVGSDTTGRPSHTWLRAIEADLKPLNIGLSFAWKKAISREIWRLVVDTATLKKSRPMP